jgi:SAM-dependent methyltransferase
MRSPEPQPAGFAGPLGDARPLGDTGLLGDTALRDYSRKLRHFNAFAEPELRAAISSLELEPGMRVLDAGCGTGEALHWLWDAVRPEGAVIGIDLAAAHVEVARRDLPPPMRVLQANLLESHLLGTELPPASFDLVWCVNTIHHLRDPLQGVQRLVPLLRPGGRIALGQSSLLPDMYFAWDARLERLTNDAVREYYRHRYAIEERDLAGVRSMLGLLRQAPLRNARVRSFVIERVTPLTGADRAYLLEAIFKGTWGERLRPYLAPADYAELALLCDPERPEFALRRPDFHFLQTFSLAVGEVIGSHASREM